MKTSIDHLPEKKQRELLSIITILRDEFDAYMGHKSSIPKDNKIAKIILFGSYAKGGWVNDPANGYTSDYDILILLNGETLVEEYSLWNKAEEKIRRHITVPLSIIIHSIEDVSNLLHQGHYFFSDIQRQGIELYSGIKKDLRQPGNLSVAEQKSIAKKHYEQWFKSANGFLKTYHFNMSENELNIAAFLLHQATERFYSCTLLVFSNYKPKTHDIEELRGFCGKHDSRFLQTFPGKSQFNRRSFQRLKRAYIESRYSEHYVITEEELNWLAEQVEALKVLTKACCKAKMAEFDV